MVPEKSKQRILVPLAEGFEEIEAVTIVDVLRRAGLEVTVAGLRPGAVTGSHGIAVTPDADLGDLAAEGAQPLGEDAQPRVSVPGRVVPEEEDPRPRPAGHSSSLRSNLREAICSARSPRKNSRAPRSHISWMPPVNCGAWNFHQYQP